MGAITTLKNCVEDLGCVAIAGMARSYKARMAPHRGSAPTGGA